MMTMILSRDNGKFLASISPSSDAAAAVSMTTVVALHTLVMRLDTSHDHPYERADGAIRRIAPDTLWIMKNT